jgi:cytochrome bd ubiquinol oxidase subunit I
MQTPAGYNLVVENGKSRAHITDFWAMVFNPSSIPRLSHVYLGCWLTGAFFVMGLAALYLLRKKHERFAKISLRIGLVIAIAASLGQLVTGHQSAMKVAATQPEKLAAFEAHFADNTPGDLYLMGWVDTKDEQAWGLKLPGMLSWLVSFDRSTPLPGLKRFPSEEQPPVQIVFQTYHLMVAIGTALIGLSLLGIFLWWKGILFSYKPYLWVLVLALILPQLANQLGWISAEVGRQPWIVYRLLRTADAVSKTLGSQEVLFSLFLFGSVYLILFAAFLYLTVKAVQKGPSFPNGRS